MTHDKSNWPVLVLLPGLDGTGDLFAPFIQAINGHIATQIISYPPDKALSYNEFERLVLSQLPTNQNFILLGESFSSAIAIKIAAQGLPQLKALILCVGFAKSPIPSARFLRHALPLFSKIWVPTSVLSYFLFGRFATKDRLEALKRSLGKLNNLAFRSRLALMMTLEVTPSLKKIKVPVLYLQASEDALIKPKSAHLIVENCPQTQVVTFSAPHALLQTVPNEAFESIKKLTVALRG